jgi:hypothetical protein
MERKAIAKAARSMARSIARRFLKTSSFSLLNFKPRNLLQDQSHSPQ